MDAVGDAAAESVAKGIEAGVDAAAVNAAVKRAARAIARIPAAPPWSRRRWMLAVGGGPEILRGAQRVASHRLYPLDRTRYPGWRLRAIRGHSFNFWGEPRR
jgi:hypothetical protein